MQVKSINMTLEETGESQKKRLDYENIFLRKAKIKVLAYKGAFDGIFTPAQIRDAKIKGNLPNGYAVHHIYPLGTKEAKFDLDNMVIMDKRTHNYFHREIYDPALKKCKPGQSCSIWLPDMDTTKVITWKDIEVFAREYIEYKKQYYGGR